MKRGRIMVAALTACALTACQWLLGLESREVGEVGDGATDAPAGDGATTGDADVEAASDADAAAPSCEAGTVVCDGHCVRTADDALHCGGCDHACLAVGCDAGLCAIEPEIVLLDRSYNGYFAASSSYFFVTDLVTTFTFDRKAKVAIGNRPYAPGDQPLEGFEANELAVYTARKNGVMRVAAPSTTIFPTYIGPDPGPPLLGLRILGGRFAFVTGEELYGAIDTNAATLLATLPNLTTAITQDPPAPTPASMYVTDTQGTIYTVPVNGGTPQVWSSGVPDAVVATAGVGFRIFASRTTVWSVAATATPPVPKKIYDGAAWISDLRADIIRPYVYVLDRGDEEGTTGRLVRVPLGGGAPVVLLTGISAPLNLYLEKSLAYTLDRGRTTPSPHTVKILGVPR